MTRLYIATPSHDMMVHIAYHWSMVRLWANPPCELVPPASSTLYDGDLVRVRSRMVADFLESDATHLLFIDSDTDFTPECVAGMLEAATSRTIAPGVEYVGVDYVAAPYRRKRADKIEFTVGIGMTLLSRAMLQRMTDHYRPTLERNDYPQPGKLRPTVMLFQLLDDGASVLSEDFSFMRRWEAIGGEPMVYTGNGAPVGHWGSFRFSGSLADLEAT